MDGRDFGGMMGGLAAAADAGVKAITFFLYLLIALIPLSILGIWKLVEIIMWIFHH